MRGDQGSSGWQEKLFMWFLYAVDEPACGKAFNVEGAQNVNMIIVTLPYEEKKINLYNTNASAVYIILH